MHRGWRSKAWLAVVELCDEESVVQILHALSWFTVNNVFYVQMEAFFLNGYFFSHNFLSRFD
jgi:hypothetical protein